MQAGNWRAAFADTIESQLVPQLLALTGRPRQTGPDVHRASIETVAEAAVVGEPDVIIAEIESFCERGGTFPEALLRLVAPAARLLGDDWDTDKRDFMDVTVGLGTLHQVVSDLSARHLAAPIPLPGRRILLGPTPGEHHTFGLALVDHFFRVAHWDVDFRPYADRAELAGAVRDNWFGIVGLSLSGDTLVEDAADTISVLRRLSRNKAIKVLVGGPAFIEKRKLGLYLGADAVAEDGRDAVQIAEDWFEQGVLGVRQ